MGHERLVIDTSAILALYFKEPAAAAVAEWIDSAICFVSAVTVAETVIQLSGRQLVSSETLLADLRSLDIGITGVDVRQAVLAGEARGKYPLNLGDCFVYALAKVENAAVLTLDSDFRRCDVPVVLL